MANKKVKDQNTQSKSRKRKIIDTIGVFALACVVIASLFGYLTLNQILAEKDKFDESLLHGDEPTTIMMKDENGEDVPAIQLSSGDGIRENTTYDQVPQVVIDAFLAVEDSRFFKHNGFDLPRFLKALLENIKTLSFGQGGSTLTMQMIDVTHGTTDESQNAIEKLFAKVQEIFLALEAESSLSKEEILMRYLNYINFGGVARGVQKGAEYYFGKDISEVTLSEAAFLAGVINAPNAYNPYLNYDNAVERRDTALGLMLQHGYISQEEYDLAINTELAFQLNGTTNFEGDPLQSVIDYVRDYCDEELGIDIYQGNMVIYTTFDLETQQLYEAIMNGEYGYFEDAPLGMQAGSALIDVSDGSIAAIAGGLNYTGDVRKNHGYDMEHQTGSSIKPLLDYTLAFEYLGWSTDQIIADVPRDFNGYTPQNAGGAFHGDVTILEAIARSWNIPAITALNEVVNTIGQKRVAEIMVSLGLTTFQKILDGSETLELGMAIGGSSMVATPLQMAAAYAALANGGVYTEPYAITRIEFLDGEQEDYVHEVVSRQVFSPQASYLMTELLVQAVSNYPSSFQGLMRSSYQVATKTGTSDWGTLGADYGIPTRAAKDKWTVSYTSKYSIATWQGYENDENGVPYGYLTDAQMNANIPTKINKLIFDTIHANNYPDDFVQPSGIVTITHIKGAFDNGHFAVPDGTPASMVSTGKVLSEFATLKTLTPDEISNLNSFTAVVNENAKTVDFTFTPYPDSEALNEFDGLYHGVDGFPDYTGTKVFDKKAVFGPIVYKVEVFQNGTSLGVTSFDTDTGSDTFDITPGVEARVCGYYGYQNDSSKSNQVCVTLSASETRKLGSSQTPETPEQPTDPTDETDD